MVWLLNGLVFKVLDLVPRHQQIVASILGYEYARQFTILIGIAEVVMAAWVLSRFRSGLCAIAQITLVATMNVLEFILVPELLLWGRLNALFALLFIGVVAYAEFVLHAKLNLKVTE
jgi:hypothetical protein